MCYGIGMGGWVDLDGCERVPYGPCTLSQVGKSRWIRFLRFLFFFFFFCESGLLEMSVSQS